MYRLFQFFFAEKYQVPRPATIHPNLGKRFRSKSTDLAFLRAVEGADLLAGSCVSNNSLSLFEMRAFEILCPISKLRRNKQYGALLFHIRCNPI